MAQHVFTFTLPDYARSKWEIARRTGKTRYSLLMVMKVAFEFHRAARDLQAAYREIDEHCGDDWNYFLSSDFVDPRYDALRTLFTITGRKRSNPMPIERPINDGGLWPVMGNNAEWFPISVWRKQAGRIRRDAARIRRAVAQATA